MNRWVREDRLTADENERIVLSRQAEVLQSLSFVSVRNQRLGWGVRGASRPVRCERPRPKAGMSR
jgi:hypothetical protein